eukprot:jgi/Mesvir1/1520/Mv14503-RA.1
MQDRVFKISAKEFVPLRKMDIELRLSKERSDDASGRPTAYDFIKNKPFSSRKLSPYKLYSKSVEEFNCPMPLLDEHERWKSFIPWSTDFKIGDNVLEFIPYKEDDIYFNELVYHESERIVRIRRNIVEFLRQKGNRIPWRTAERSQKDVHFLSGSSHFEVPSLKTLAENACKRARLV